MVSLPPEAERGWIPIIFDRGVGARRAEFGARQSRFGRLLTFIPGQITLPLVATSTTPVDIEGSKTNFACMKEVCLGGTWYVVVVKGGVSWVATGDTLGDKQTVASAEGRQLISGYTIRYGANRLFWFCGASANVQQTADLTGAWTAAAGTGDENPVALDCGWFMGLIVYGLTTAGVCYSLRTGTDGWSTSGITTRVPPETSTGVIPIGELGDPLYQFLANGSAVYKVSTTALVAIYKTGLRDITAACEYLDEAALTDGPRVVLWHPSRPVRDISIWRDEGCPPDMKGNVRSLQAVGQYLIALWELDAGGTIVFMGRQVANDKFDWHPVSGTILGEFPLSIGSNFVLAQKTYSSSKRLWVCTADASDGRAYRQDWPKGSWNPLDDTAMEYEYDLGSSGWLYQYSPWYDLITASELLAEMKRVMALASVTATSLIHLAYRPGPDAANEETYTWPDDILFNDKGLVGEFPARPRPQMVQFRLGMQRASGTATDTPVLFNLFLSAWARAERGLETLR